MGAGATPASVQTLLSMPGTGSGNTAKLKIGISPSTSGGNVQLTHWRSSGNSTIHFKVGASGMDWEGSAGTMKHFVIQRSAESGGNVTWRLGFDGEWIDPKPGNYVNQVIAYESLDSTSLIVGKDTTGSYNSPVIKAWIDDVRISTTDVYTYDAATGTYTAPTAPLAPAGAPLNHPVSIGRYLDGVEQKGSIGLRTILITRQVARRGRLQGQGHTTRGLMALLNM